jgi:site-specific DNA recombinase
MTRVALYARFSSDLQEDRSVDDQLLILREEAARKGWTIVAEYQDRAISGASIIGRPGLVALLADAERRKFDVVFSEALDRLSRGQADTAIIHRDLEYLSIPIVTLSEGNVEDIHVGMKGVMNSMFLKELGRKVRRGLMGRINEGKSAGGLTYGYEPVPGEVRGLLRIVDAEAEIVRRIYRDYALNVSPRAIAIALNAEGVKGPRGNGWRASTISGQAHAGNGILNNELYIGKRIWNRRRKKKDPKTGKARMFPNPPELWRTVDVPDLRIVPDDLWRAVRARQAGHSQRGRHHARRPTRLLSGLLQCGVCNGPMAIVGGISYGCSNHREKGACPNVRTVSATVVETRVIEGLKTHLLHPDAIREAASAYHQEKVRLQKEGVGRKRELERDIAELDRRIARAVDAIVEGTASEGLRTRLKAMETDKAGKTDELAAVMEDNVVALRPQKAAKDYAALVATLSEVLRGDNLEEQLVRQTLRELVHRIILMPRAGDKGYDFLVKGDLAALLGGRRVSLGVGAGIGFGLERSGAPYELRA